VIDPQESSVLAAFPEQINSTENGKIWILEKGLRCNTPEPSFHVAACACLDTDLGAVVTDSSLLATLTVSVLVTGFAGAQWLYHRPYPDRRTHQDGTTHLQQDQQVHSWISEHSGCVWCGQLQGDEPR